MRNSLSLCHFLSYASVAPKALTEKKRFGPAARELMGSDIVSEPVPFENQRNCKGLANTNSWVKNKFGFPVVATAEIEMFEFGDDGRAT
jgi:hypothetical protein